MSIVIWNHKHRNLHRFTYLRLMNYRFREKFSYAESEKFRAREAAAYSFREMRVLNPAQFQAVLDCPPIGLAQTYKMRRCHIWHVCPTCYALKMGSVYDAIVGYLGRANRIWTFEISRSIDGTPVATMAADLLRQAKALQRRLRPDSFLQIRFPVCGIDRGGFLWARIVIIAVRHHGGPQIREYDAAVRRASKLGLAETLKTIAYPRSMVFNEDADVTESYALWSKLRMRINVHHEPGFRFPRRQPARMPEMDAPAPDAISSTASPRPPAVQSPPPPEPQAVLTQPSVLLPCPYPTFDDPLGMRIITPSFSPPAPECSGGTPPAQDGPSFAVFDVARDLMS